MVVRVLIDAGYCPCYDGGEGINVPMITDEDTKENREKATTTWAIASVRSKNCVNCPKNCKVRRVFETLQDNSPLNTT